MRGKRIKQINNWIIRYTEIHQYSVWSPDGRCYEDRLTLEQAEEFCRDNKDYVAGNNICEHCFHSSVRDGHCLRDKKVPDDSCYGMPYSNIKSWIDT